MIDQTNYYVIGGFPTIRSKISSLTNHRIQVCVIRGKSNVYCLFDFSLASLPAINVKLSLEPFDKTGASITVRDKCIRFPDLKHYVFLYGPGSHVVNADHQF
eukprot:524054_1